jgi:hypothetical protein
MVVDATVALKINAIFPEEHHEPALRILEAYPGRAGTRLQLAMLKNSDGDLDKLADQVRLAEVDYRDVLALAEYPRQLRTAAGEVTDEMQKADRQDYESWLQGDQ